MIEHFNQKTDMLSQSTSALANQVFRLEQKVFNEPNEIIEFLQKDLEAAK